MTIQKKSLPNFIKLLDKRGFIIPCFKSNSQQDILYDHGPLGTLLRQNVIKQWWDGINKQGYTSVYPVECSPGFIRKTRDHTELIVSRESLEKDCVSQLQRLLTLTNRTLPLSVGAVGPCVGHCGRAVAEEERMLNGSATHTQLLLQSYVPPTHAGRAVDLWLGHRLAWWKNFARHPAQFTVDSSSSNEGDASSKSNGSESSSDKHMSIYFQFPWGRRCVETLHNCRDTYLRHLDPGGDYTAHTQGRGARTPGHMLQCVTTVEAAALAWLWDAFSERESVTPVTADGRHRTRNVLHLHNRLAPYQAAVVCDPPSDPTDLPKMLASAGHLARRLQGRGVRVFDASPHGSNRAAHINRCDELGVPYTVIISDSTLADGVLVCRVRDTEMEMSSHITHVADQISGYLRAQLQNNLHSGADPDLLTSQPLTSQPLTSQPLASQYLTSQPVASQTLTSQPMTSQSLTSQPLTSQPLTSQPVTSQPLNYQPKTTESPTSQSQSYSESTLTSIDSSCNNEGTSVDSEKVSTRECGDDNLDSDVNNLDSYDNNPETEGKCVQISFGDDSVKGASFHASGKTGEKDTEGLSHKRVVTSSKVNDSGSDTDEDKFVCEHENHIIGST